MPGDSLYWNPVENDTDDSIQEREPYIDPWDLENYAYIREHLDSLELSSNPSGSSGVFAEATQSFDYVPGNKRDGVFYSPNVREENNFDSIISDQENYAHIEEFQVNQRRIERSTSEMHWPIRRRIMEEYESDAEKVSPYAEGIIQEKSVSGIHDKRGVFQRVALPIFHSKSQKDRSLSFSYGDYDYDAYNSSARPEIHTKMNDNRGKPISEISDDFGKNNRYQERNKPQNFTFSKNGHLKIDYTYSWNNLNKYMNK